MVKLDRRTIWREDQFVPSDVTARIPPLPIMEQPATIGAAPEETPPEAATVGVPVEGFKLPFGLGTRARNPRSEVWQLPEDEQERALTAFHYGGMTALRKVFPQISEAPFTAGGFLPSLSRGVTEALGGEKEIPMVRPSPTGEVVGRIGGEIAKIATLYQTAGLAGLSGLAADLAAGGAWAAWRQAERIAEKKDITVDEVLDGFAEEAIVFPAVGGLGRAVSSALKAKPVSVNYESVKEAVPKLKSTAPLVTSNPKEAELTLSFFGYNPEVARSIQQSWATGVDNVAKKAVQVVPKKVRDWVNVNLRGVNDPEFNRIIKDRELAIRVRREEAENLAAAIKDNVPKEFQFEVYKTLDPTHIGDLGEFPAAYRKFVNNARNKIDELSLEYIGLDLLPRETVMKNIGEYISRYYSPKEHALRSAKDFWVRRFHSWFRRGIRGRQLKRRVLTTTEQRERAGLITDPAFAVSNTIKDMTYDIETARAFRRIAQNPEWVSATEREGFKAIPNSKKYGDLAGKWIRGDLFPEIETIVHTRSEIGRMYDRLLGLWKFGKTALNPATHGRNIFSNVILADFGGLSPMRVDVYAKAAREYLKKGPLYKEAQKLGLFGTDWYEAEVRRFLKPLSKKKSMFDFAFDLAGETGPVRLAAKAGDLYQAEEHFFKLALYMHQRTKGFTPTQSVAHAHKYLFDYSDVAPLLRKLRRSPVGNPFLTFTAKMLPVTLETAVKHPLRVGKYFIFFYAMNEYSKASLGMSDAEYDELQAALPPWANNGFQVLLPVRGKEGRPIVWDLTYNLPWGDIAEQGTFLPVPVLGAITERFFGGNPFARVPIEVVLNKDAFRSRDIYKKGISRKLPGEFAGVPIPETLGGEMTEKVLRHSLRQFSPGILVAAPPTIEALRGKPTRTGEVPDPLTTVLNKLFGLKFLDIDVKKGKQIKVAKLKKKRDEAIEEGYRILSDKSMSEKEKAEKIMRLKMLFDEIKQEYDEIVKPRKVEPETTTVDRRSIWK